MTATATTAAIHPTRHRNTFSYARPQQVIDSKGKSPKSNPRTTHRNPGFSAFEPEKTTESHAPITKQTQFTIKNIYTNTNLHFENYSRTLKFKPMPVSVTGRIITTVVPVGITVVVSVPV